MKRTPSVGSAPSGSYLKQAAGSGNSVTLSYEPVAISCVCNLILQNSLPPTLFWFLSLIMWLCQQTGEVVYCLNVLIKYVCVGLVVTIPIVTFGQLVKCVKLSI